MLQNILLQSAIARARSSYGDTRRLAREHLLWAASPHSKALQGIQVFSIQMFKFNLQMVKKNFIYIIYNLFFHILHHQFILGDNIVVGQKHRRFCFAGQLLYYCLILTEY